MRKRAREKEQEKESKRKRARESEREQEKDSKRERKRARAREREREFLSIGQCGFNAIQGQYRDTSLPMWPCHIGTRPILTFIACLKLAKVGHNVIFRAQSMFLKKNTKDK